MSLIDALGLPGMGTPTETAEREMVAGIQSSYQQVSVNIVSTAADAGNSGVTTTLRKGILLGKITASGKRKQYDPAATDGSEIAEGVLLFDHNTLDAYAVARDGQNRMIWFGYLVAAQVINLDYMARRQLAGRIWFDDGWHDGDSYLRLVVAKATDYTVTVADNNKTFTTKGAVAAVNFTLPTLARGLRYQFYSEAGQNMTITAATADTIVAFNDLAADSIGFATVAELIGSSVEVFANSDATKWLTKVSLGAESVTPTIAT